MKKIKTPEMIKVHCPNCKTAFIRSRKSIEEREKCGICELEVTMVEGEPEIKPKAKKTK